MFYHPFSSFYFNPGFCVLSLFFLSNMKVGEDLLIHSDAHFFRTTIIKTRNRNIIPSLSQDCVGWGTNFTKGRRPLAYRVFTVKHVCADSLLCLFLCEVCMYHQNKTAAFCTLGALKWRCWQDDYSTISFLDDQSWYFLHIPTLRSSAPLHTTMLGKKLGLLHFFSFDCVYRKRFCLSRPLGQDLATSYEFCL